MAYVKDPRKYVARAVRECGGVKDFRDGYRTYYRMPDGAQVFFESTAHMGAARAFVRGLRDRYPSASSTPFVQVKDGPCPVLDLERVTASAHAIERQTLMQGQGGLTFQEILHALRIPERVRYSPTHHSWMWIGERVTVAAHVKEDGAAVISTLLWSKTELWDAFPRPTD
ncbi:hypothetical protein M2390_002602 [Mycetocola sp. BIGb0189]|uniref:hypothetical protein n=1 Tax=Mycetocola sp. BIGb0189 TaxID=2940604 RepID=UPI0021678C22|nr:hypothetical protein [Mycetocola sp. BIGb0189]MCS4277396.1 hypothetical protein [Mycetocola sp. BIGb0189]